MAIGGWARNTYGIACANLPPAQQLTDKTEYSLPRIGVTMFEYRQCRDDEYLRHDLTLLTTSFTFRDKMLPQDVYWHCRWINESVRTNAHFADVVNHAPGSAHSTAYRCNLLETIDNKLFADAAHCRQWRCHPKSSRLSNGRYLTRRKHEHHWQADFGAVIINSFDVTRQMESANSPEISRRIRLFEWMNGKPLRE